MKKYLSRIIIVILFTLNLCLTNALVVTTNRLEDFQILYFNSKRELQDKTKEITSLNLDLENQNLVNNHMGNDSIELIDVNHQKYELKKNLLEGEK